MFLTPGAKLARKVDVNTPLYNSIASTRGEAAAAKTVTACRTFQQLRSALHEPPTTAATRLAIKRYLSAFNYIVNQNGVPSTISAPLLWVNAFDGNDHCVVQDLALDHVAALFNLGVCEATLAGVAYRTRRTDPDAMKTAARHFQVAAGYFKAASELPSPGGIRAITCDLYPPSLKALEMVMLGNAQQILYEMTLETGSANSAFLARFAIGARDFYLIAEESCRDPDVVNTCINGYVGRPAGALAAYFDVVAQSAQADACREQHDMSQQLTRLVIAQKSAEIGLSTVSALDTSSLASVTTLRGNVIAELQNLQKSLAKRKEEADEENRKVYLQSPAPSVSDIVGRQGVRAVDVSSVLTEEKVDDRLHPFGELPEPIAEELSGVARRYAEMVESMVAEQVATINAASTNLRELIAQTEASIEAARRVAAVPASGPAKPQSSVEEDQVAIDAVKHAQERGGLNSVVELKGQVLKMANETKLQVQAVESLLHTEELEDRQLRSRCHVSRPTSISVTHHYTAKLSSIRANLEQAANADKIVAQQIELHGTTITAMVALNVAGLVPVSVKIDSSSAEKETQRTEALIGEMQPQLSTGKRLLVDKDGVVQEFEKTKHLENPYTVTAGITDGDEEVEKCSAIMERSYADLKMQAQRICNDMKRVAEFLLDANVRLKIPAPEEKKGDDTQNRMNEVYRHQAAALKFKEIMGHLEQGTVFYTREQDVIEVLRRDIEGFVAARRAEAQEIERVQSAQSHSQYSGIYPPGPPYTSNPNSYPPNNPGHYNPYGTEAPHHGPPGAWRRQ